MNKLKNIKWQSILDKVGTVVVDRRFYEYFVIPTVIAWGIFPYITEANSEVLSGQAVAWAELIVASVVPIISAWLLGISWTNRPPSGLDYKELTIDQIIEAASKDN